MKKVMVHKSGWNTMAAIGGPFWYMYKGMAREGILLLAIWIFTAGIGIIPVGVYCGCNGNKNFYSSLKRKNAFIY